MNVRFQDHIDKRVMEIRERERQFRSKRKKK